MNGTGILPRAAALLALWLVAGAAAATVIAFNPLVGNNADVYAGHSENGFTVTPVEGAWLEAHLNGNPVPSIFSTSDTAGVEVVREDGGTFSFTSVDLDDAAPGSVPTVGFRVVGQFMNGDVFDVQGVVDPTVEFPSVPSPDTSALIDKLLITMTKNQTTSYNIDNVVLDESPPISELPAPATLLLLAAGIGLAVTRRRG